jgi:hypothetical protein
LRSLTRYWLGQIDWPGLVAAGLELDGERWLQRSLRAWLGQSAFAGVERPARRAPRVDGPRRA